jgi:TPR repeat protein
MVVLAALPYVAACAPSHSYAGISLQAGAADPEMQALAARAQIGDKQAQLELGMRYEAGLGVVRDLGRAKWLYASAAAPSGGTMWIYVPGVGKSRGSVMPVNMGPHLPGLPEAKARLRRLRDTAPHS